MVASRVDHKSWRKNPPHPSIVRIDTKSCLVKLMLRSCLPIGVIAGIRVCLARKESNSLTSTRGLELEQKIVTAPNQSFMNDASIGFAGETDVGVSRARRQPQAISKEQG